MPFPRSPKKKVSGKLSLIIKPPGKEVEIEAEEDINISGSEDNIISFSPPAGFSVSKTFEELVSFQIERAQRRIKDIDDNRSKCSNCAKSASDKMIEDAYHFLNCVKDAFTEGKKFSVVVGQEEDIITIDVHFDGRQLSTIIGRPTRHKENIEMGIYSSDILVEETRTNSYKVLPTIYNLLSKVL